jgi:archaellum component FlaF (FlaF/FlaG flagellin family)
MKTSREAVETLNKALKIDSEALTALFSVRIAASKELSEKTPFKCKITLSENGQTSYNLSMLEVLQGIFEEYGIHYELNAKRQITSFRIDNPYGL